MSGSTAKQLPIAKGPVVIDVAAAVAVAVVEVVVVVVIASAASVAVVVVVAAAFVDRPPLNISCNLDY